MFFTYLGRELRRRLRQALLIAIGLAIGTGLVITVTAASNGVKNSQAAVLHSLYGAGTDITITQPPAKGQSTATTFGFSQQIKEYRSGQLTAGTKINVNNLVNSEYGNLNAGSVARVAGVRNVSAAVGSLSLTDVTVTGTVPAVSASGSFSSSFKTDSFTVAGVDTARTGLGALSGAKITSGRNLTAADASANNAVAAAGYATQHKLAIGDSITVGGTAFKIIGIASVPQGGSPPDVYIPLARAQKIGKSGSTSLAGKVNTIYVRAASAADITAVQQQIARMLPAATITDQDNLASQVSGSLSSASSLANNLGKWLSAAVLIAAFLLASLLTMAAVSRRVREFGTLKALGWPSRRIVGQVMGESLATGIAGGALGIALGCGGAALIDVLAPRLYATVGTPGASSTSGGLGGGLRTLEHATHTVSVTLTAPVTIRLALLAVLIAILGGLIAGMFGGWRAARLRPAAALAKVD